MLYCVRENHMDYKSFIHAIEHEMKEILGDGYHIQINKVLKNNSLELDSLLVLQKGENIAPTIYLMPYYEAYLDGTPVDTITQRLCSICQDVTVPVLSETFEFSYEEMKPYIIYRLVNYERNKKLLKQIPYIKYLDLAITFHCLVKNNKEGIGTIRVTNEHLSTWGAELEEVEELAVKNTIKFFPLSIRSMDEVMRCILSENYMDEHDVFIPDEMMNQILYKSDSIQHNYQMFVLSNMKGINGATSMLYPNAIRDFAYQINSNFYILPSSIHEVILVPDQNNIKKETLEEMVKDINYTQVPPDEILSDRVYYYSKENNVII